MATQSSILAWEILVDGGAWLTTVHWISKSLILMYSLVFKQLTMAKGYILFSDSSKDWMV